MYSQGTPVQRVQEQYKIADMYVHKLCCGVVTTGADCFTTTAWHAM